MMFSVKTASAQVKSRVMVRVPSAGIAWEGVTATERVEVESVVVGDTLRVATD